MTGECPHRVVIFGLGQLSSLAWYCLTHDSEFEVAAFTVEDAFLDRGELHGLPVASFERLEETHPPDTHSLLVPIGYRDINGARMRLYRAGKERGYRFPSYVSSRASVWPDLHLGENSMVFEQAVVQPFVSIGDDVIVRSGAHLSHHVSIGDHCFLAAHAVVAGGTTVGERCLIGANATVGDGLDIAPRCIIGAGALVLSDTTENGVYAGTPARRGRVPADRMRFP